MGDRTTRHLPCPKCGKESEQYDAPSCLIWDWHCDSCGWVDNRDYYEVSDDTIYLCTKKELKKFKKDDPEIDKFRKEIDEYEKLRWVPMNIAIGGEDKVKEEYEE